jgi:hypothetical protein
MSGSPTVAGEEFEWVIRIASPWRAEVHKASWDIESRTKGGTRNTF